MLDLVAFVRAKQLRAAHDGILGGEIVLQRDEHRRVVSYRDELMRWRDVPRGWLPLLPMQMAVAITNLTQGAIESAGTTATTASVTLTSGRCYLMWVQNNRGGDATVTSTGWTAVRRLHFDNVTLDCLRRDGDGTTAAITITYSISVTVKGWAIDEITGSQTGASLVVQSASNSGISAAPAATLAAFADATNNATVFGAAIDNTGTHCTIGSGFTARADVLIGNGVNQGTLFTEYKIGQDTAPACTSANTEWVGIGVEIAAAGGGGGGSFRNFYGSKFYGTQYAPRSPMERERSVACYYAARAAEMRRFMDRVERRAA